MGNALYIRRGWKEQEFTIANQDKEAGTVDLADAEGTMKVTALPFFSDHPDEASAPQSYAIPAGKSTSTPTAGPQVDQIAVDAIVADVRRGSEIDSGMLGSINKPTLAQAADVLGVENDSRTSKKDLIAGLLLLQEENRPVPVPIDDSPEESEEEPEEDGFETE